MIRLNKLWEKPLNRLRPGQIGARLGVFIRMYFHQRSGLLAKVVADHIEALLVHPDFDVPFEQRCAFRRLEAHWRCLAWLGDRPAMAAEPEEQPGRARRQ
jgi:hypothetical protein